MQKRVFALLVAVLCICEPYAALATQAQSGRFASIVHRLRTTESEVESEPDMAESTLDSNQSAYPMILAELAGEGEIPTVPKSELPPNFSMKPVMTKKKGFWDAKGRTSPAELVGKAQLQDMIRYDAEALQMMMKRTNGLSRVRSGDRNQHPANKKAKLMKAHYHTSTLVSPTMGKITADMAGSDGQFVEPDVIGHIPTAAPPPAPTFVSPAYNPIDTKSLSKPSDNRRPRPAVHITGPAGSLAAKKAAAAKKRAATRLVVPVPAQAVSAPKPLARRDSIARKAAPATKAQRRASKRRARAAELASILNASAKAARAIAKSAGTKPAVAAPAKPVTPAPAAAAAPSILVSVKADTTSLVAGQKKLLDYAVTATRSNPVAEQGVKLDEKILKHIVRLEDALNGILEENKSLHAMQRANLASLTSLTAQVVSMKKHAADVELAQRTAMNVKSFPHLRAISAVITSDEHVVEVPVVDHEDAVAAFHDSLTPAHTNDQALDEAITLAHESTEGEHHRFLAEHESDSNEHVADAGSKTEEEVMIERIMAGEEHSTPAPAASLLEQTASDEAESDEEESDESEDSEEEEESASEEEEEESEDEEESEEAEEAEEEEEAESEEAEEAHPIAPIPPALEEEAEEMVEIDAESEEEADIIQLAERNAALAEKHARSVMADALTEERAVVDAAVHSAAPLEMSTLESESNLETEMESTSESEEAESDAAAELLGLPQVPGSVPAAKPHDDLDEIAAEVEQELASGHSGAEIAQSAMRAASNMRFRQNSEAESESESEMPTDLDSEYESLMHDDVMAEDTEIAHEVESELVSQGGQDVDLSEVDASVDVGALDSEIDAATTQDSTAADPFADNKDVQDMKAAIASLAAELKQVKAEGARM